MPQPNVEQTSARSHQRVPPTYTPQLTIRGTWPPTYTPLRLNLLVRFPNSSGLGNLTTYLNTSSNHNIQFGKTYATDIEKGLSRILQSKMMQSQRCRKVDKSQKDLEKRPMWQECATHLKRHSGEKSKWLDRLATLCDFSRRSMCADIGRNTVEKSHI